MYLIQRDRNRLERLEARTFGSLGLRERNDLQEWIAAEPGVLGEELLIIQKEFAGFSDTQERLDLLALDKGGNLVVIENKLDDSGRDVTWQALKYASYCSSLAKDNIRTIFQRYLDQRGGGNAEERLAEFFGEDYEDLQLNTGITQRVVLIAANFRKEVTSTVLWLLNFKLRIQCFKATPYALGDQLFLRLDQIIPMPDAEEYTIRMAEKAQQDAEHSSEEARRHVVRRGFWSALLEAMNARSTLFQGVSPTRSSELSTGAGISSTHYQFIATGTYVRAALYLNRKPGEENEILFNHLLKEREEIETRFGDSLNWDPMEGLQACRITYDRAGNIFDQEQWPELVEFLARSIVRLADATQQPLMRAGQSIRTGSGRGIRRGPESARAHNEDPQPQQQSEA